MKLKEEEIRFVFNESVLKVGDILLMDTYDERQRSRMLNDKYLHAAIYLGDAFLMEADGLGVVMNHIYSYAFKELEHACVLRLKEDNLKVIKDAIYWVRGKMGMEFGSKEALIVPRKKDTDNKDTSNRSFCSRLIAQAYREGGANIVRNPNFCSPDDFLRSELLQIVSDPVQPFTEEIAKTVMNAQNERYDSDWNTCLQSLYENMNIFYGNGCDIQSIDQLFLAVLKNIDREDDALKVLKGQLWMKSPHEQTLVLWPWLDNDDIFFKHFPTIYDVLFFLHNQFLHYDKTYLPIFRENAINVCILAKMRQDSKVMQLMKEHFDAILDEGIRVRKRIEELYILTFMRDEEEFLKFIKQYGPYHNFEYDEGVIDIGRTFSALMK
jgi:Orthopoxvirus protein of unknown function (DUF830).